MIYALRVHLKINFIEIIYGSKYRTVLTQKKNTGTETNRLVYNKFKIDNNYANKTRR